MPEGVELVAFADDLAVVGIHRDQDILESRLDSSLELILRWMVENGLQLAIEKTEAYVLSTRSMDRDPEVRVGDDRVSVRRGGEGVRYLGITLDTGVGLQTHIRQAAEKAGVLMNKLGMLLPNVGGPRSSRRRLLASVALSVLLYGAPVWSGCLRTARIRQTVERVRRRAALRVVSGYRTVSGDAAGVLAGIPPIHLIARERSEVFRDVRERGRERLREWKSFANNEMWESWQGEWEAGTKGGWTRRLIPQIKIFVERKFGEVNYYLSQVLTGHGCFEAYLFRIGKREAEVCRYCDERDDAEHTLFVCPMWDDLRSTAERSLHERIGVDNMVNIMLRSAEKWSVIQNYVEVVMKTKERDERLLEAEDSLED